MELVNRLKVMRILDLVTSAVLYLSAIAAGAALAAWLGFSWSSDNVADIKAHAAETIMAAGFKPVGYTGYTHGSISSPGGRVWYTVERGGVTYELYVSKWKDEYHVYRIIPLTPTIIAK